MKHLKRLAAGLGLLFAVAIGLGLFIGTISLIAWQPLFLMPPLVLMLAYVIGKGVTDD